MKRTKFYTLLILAVFTLGMVAPGSCLAKKKEGLIEFSNHAGATYAMPLKLVADDYSCSTVVQIDSCDQPHVKASKTAARVNLHCCPPCSAISVGQWVLIWHWKDGKDMKRVTTHIFAEGHEEKITGLLPGDRVDGIVTLLGDPSYGSMAITVLGQTATTITTGQPTAMAVLESLSIQLNNQGVNTVLGIDYLLIPDIGEEGITVDIDDSVMIAIVTVELTGAIPTLTEWGLIIFGVVLLGFITWVFLKRRKAIGVKI